MCGGPAPYASSAMRPTAHTQQASSRAVATFALLLWTPRASSASRLSTGLRTPLAACLRVDWLHWCGQFREGRKRREGRI